MSYGVYYVLFLVCIALLFVLLIDFARNRAEHRDGYVRTDTKRNQRRNTA